MKSQKIIVKQSLTYPCLMESIENGDVVLFTSETVGTRLNQSNKSEIGYYSKEWVPSSDAEIWKPFTGQIILEN